MAEGVNGQNCPGPSLHHSLRDLSGLRLKRLLSDSADRKRAVVEVEVAGSNHPAVVVLDKLPFSEADIQGLLTESTLAQQEFNNDIYGQYRLSVGRPEHNLLQANIVHPATQKHIDKYLASPAQLVVETPALYHAVTLPFIQAEQFSLEWVYNVLEHKKEADRIIYENPDPSVGFILAPDFKWSGKQVEDLYCLAIVHKRGIRSLRELRRAHLPMLRTVLAEGKAAIFKKFGLPHSKIRAYIHYQPSYYHLHIHFTNIDYDPPGVNCEKSHILETVINNIELDANYYRKASLMFNVREKDRLYAAYRNFGYFASLPTAGDKIPSAVAAASILDREFEEGSCDPVLDFFAMLGKAKHEPSGEFWETTYGESAWRMAIMAMCLPEYVNRRHLVSLCLVSSFASFGSANDENTVWDTKLTEVRDILRTALPPLVAGELSALFEEHVAVRRGRLDGSKEQESYRGILELEEILLRWEEEAKDLATQPSREPLLHKLASLGFPGSDRFTIFGDNSHLEKALNFIMTASRLMRLKRTGWVRCQVREPETVSGHMFRMGVMGLVHAHQNRDTIREGDACILSICHDLAEAIIGDITPHCKVSAEDKQKQEMVAYSELVDNLPDSYAMNFLTAFKRYEDQQEGDYDAILTKDYDKFDMILQAFEYEKKYKRGPFLQQFFDSTRTAIRSATVKKWQTRLLQAREEFFTTANITDS